MKKRLCSLDIIKVVCTIIILLHHFQLETGFITSKVNMASGKIYCGYVVEFFFIISGFVTSMQIEGISHQKFGDYLKKKAIRLYPMTIISILVNLMIIVVFYCTFGYWWRDSAPGMWKMLCSLSLLFSGGVIKDVPYGMNNPIWYLCVLLICYLIVWCVVFLCKKLEVNPYYWFAFICAMGVGILQYGIDLPLANGSTARGYATFFLGMLLYRLYEKSNHVKLCLASGGILIISMLLMVKNFELFVDNQWGVLSFIVFPAILFLILGGENRYFFGSIWNKLGEVSFEVYLWHVNGIIIYMMLNMKFPDVFVYTTKGMIIFSVVMFVWAYIMYTFVETPLIKCLRRKYIDEQK